MRAIRKNMTDQLGIPACDKQILHCPACDGEWSGHAGDYWDLPDDHVFVCADCEIELELVVKRTSVEYIQ